MKANTTEAYAHRTLTDELGFPLSPHWRDGWLWFSDALRQQVRAIDETGKNMAVIDFPDQPCDLGWTPDGRLLVAAMTERKLLRYNGRRLVEFADLSDFTDDHLNGLLVDPAGRAYISCSGFDDRQTAAPRPTRLVLVEANGHARTEGTDLLFANGMAITPDGRTLMVAEAFAERISAFNIAADGTLDCHRVWAPLSGLMPAGLCLDREGAAWVASPMSGEVLRVKEEGEVLDRIPVTGNPTGCALGGEEGRTLFVTATKLISPHRRSGRIDAIRVAIGATDRDHSSGPLRYARKN